MWTNSTPVTPGADDDEVVGPGRRRVGVAGRQDPLAVDLGPVGEARPAPGGEEDRRRPRSRSAPSTVSATTWCGPTQPTAAPEDPHALAVEQLPRAVLELLLDGLDPGLAAPSGSTSACGRGEPHLRGPPDRRRARRRWRSWPSRGCSPRGGPPRRSTSCSITVTSAPRRAAWVAAVFPAGPPPMITNRSGMAPRLPIRTAAAGDHVRSGDGHYSRAARAPQRPVPGDRCRRQPPRSAQLHRSLGAGRQRPRDGARRPPPAAHVRLRRRLQLPRPELRLRLALLRRLHRVLLRHLRRQRLPDRLAHRRLVEGRRLQLLRRRRPLLHGLPQAVRLVRLRRLGHLQRLVQRHGVRLRQRPLRPPQGRLHLVPLRQLQQPASRASARSSAGSSPAPSRGRSSPAARASAVRTDNNTRGHNRPCLQAAPPIYPVAGNWDGDGKSGHRLLRQPQRPRGRSARRPT